jgi:hypothetical protein
LDLVLIFFWDEQEVILFPAMKPEEGSQKTEKAAEEQKKE